MTEATQKTIEGAFPEKCEAIEIAAHNFLLAKKKSKKAGDRQTTAYDSLKEEMREHNLTEYHCYTQRTLVTLDAEDPKVKVRDLKADEPTPYAPSQAEQPPDFDDG